MKDSFRTKKKLSFKGQDYFYHSLPDLARSLGTSLENLPFSHRVLLENLLRTEDGRIVTREDIEFLARRQPLDLTEKEIQFQPARVLLQDFTGVPVIADLAATREAVVQRGGRWEQVNPLQQVDLVIDHSVQVDVFGRPDALSENTRIEFERNVERYQFLKWGQENFKNLRIVPPATGICHQVNIEYLAQGVGEKDQNGEIFLFPDSVIGTDSHTPMVNSLGIVGWGVGGIEAEAAMLGQPISLLIPPVVGMELIGKLPAGMTSTDLVLNITQALRKHGVVGKFVEFFGEGLKSLAAADRATVSNMAPEYGATIGLFPPDEATLDYFKATGREQLGERMRAYYETQGMWKISKPSQYEAVLKLDLNQLHPTLAGPSKPHEKNSLSQVPISFRHLLSVRQSGIFNSIAPEKVQTWVSEGGEIPEVKILMGQHRVNRPTELESFDLRAGDVVIAAITSCTNTSNQRLMIAAGLMARKAKALGLKSKPWVKTSFAPGSRVVSDYMKASGLLTELEYLGFHLVGFGCTTCIGNSGPLPSDIAELIQQKDVATVSVLSGNRNFEARIQPLVLGNYLASPPLVVAYALAGTILKDLSKDPVAHNHDGRAVTLQELWPSEDEIDAIEREFIKIETYKKNYDHVLEGDEHWKSLPSTKSSLYNWDQKSLYLQKPPFMEEPWNKPPPNSFEARILAVFGDFITTDHISPAGSISMTTPAAAYLIANGLNQKDFNSYGARRGNHHVMVRGTFANVRIRNKLADREGGWTKLYPEKKQVSIFEAAEEYRIRNTPLVVFAGKEYGSGSSRDWAAKGTRLLGVQAVIAEGFERIHRSNLVGMGILPLQLPHGTSTEGLQLTGEETVRIMGLEGLQPRAKVKVEIVSAAGSKVIECLCRVDTANELAYYKAGGLLPFMVDRLVNNR